MMKRGRSWSGRERHCMYLHLGTNENGRVERFANVSAISGMDYPEDGRSLCLVDWDHDGDLDFWISNRTAPQLRFLRNDAPRAGRFLGLRLEGQKGNRDAIGARVVVEVPGRGHPIVKTVRAGDGYLAQSSKELIFGLGEFSGDVAVTVRWPGGAVDKIENLPADVHYRMAEGGEPLLWERPPSDLALRPGVTSSGLASDTVRVPMVTLLKVPILEYEDMKGKVAKVPKVGRFTLLNLWASWCAPCLSELEEFKDRFEDLETAGVEVVALALDGVGQDKGDPSTAKKRAAKMNLPFSTGLASEKILTILERLHVRLTPMELDLVIPLSLLIDREGRLAVLYKGAPGVDKILADLEHSSLARWERLVGSAGLGGESLEKIDSTVRVAANQLEVSQRFQFAQDMWQGRWLAAAEVQFRDTLAVTPDFAEAANNLGLVHATAGQHDKAVTAYQRALSLRDDFADGHMNLGLSLDLLGQTEAARNSFLRALEVDPALPKANDALGLLHAKRGELAVAKKYFIRETEVNPDFAEGFNHLGLIYLSLNQATSALDPLRKAVSLDSQNADALNNLGLACKRLGLAAEAGKAFENCVRVNPRFVPGLINLGLFHIDTGNLVVAEQCLIQALKIQPDSAMARRNLSRVQSMRAKE